MGRALHLCSIGVCAAKGAQMWADDAGGLFAFGLSSGEVRHVQPPCVGCRIMVLTGNATHLLAIVNGFPDSALVSEIHIARYDMLLSSHAVVELWAKPCTLLTSLDSLEYRNTR